MHVRRASQSTGTRQLSPAPCGRMDPSEVDDFSVCVIRLLTHGHASMVLSVHLLVLALSF
jgi:hypothetical protein